MKRLVSILVAILFVCIPAWAVWSAALPEIPWIHPGSSGGVAEDIGTENADPAIASSPHSLSWGTGLSLQPAGVDGAESPHVSITVTPKYNSASGIPAGGANYNGPGSQTTTGQVEVNLELSAPLGPNATFLTRGTATYDSASATTTTTLDRLYLDLRNLFGIQGLGLRPGRDVVTLGPIGLLLDEGFYGDKRDGVQLWLPSMGPLRLYLVGQKALADNTTSRWLLGGRGEITLAQGWVVGANVRSDTAGQADQGICPGTGCNTGSGFGIDVQGTLRPGANLTLVYASYTRTGDVARSYTQARLALGLDTLAGMERFGPVATFWYKNYGPYTLPGGPSGTAPRGLFRTPDDFALFSVNDNLVAAGARLDLRLREGLGLFVLGEWGAYKDNGPGYSVYSTGVVYALARNVNLKLTYNTYSVVGGTVTTSPVSGIQLGSVNLFHFEVQATW